MVSTHYNLRGRLTYTQSTAKANILNKQFASVYTKEDQTSIPSLHGESFPDIGTLYIESNGIEKLLSELNPHKATGPDNISSRFLKETAHYVAPLLTFIFQSSINQGKLPVDWKDAFVVPAYKKGSRIIAANYRPISLTSICCKILEYVIHSFIFIHIDSNNILCDHQHGFRPNHSCETRLIAEANDFSMCLNNGVHIDALFLDFAKAFDKVPHERLCYKLSHYGINGPLLLWIKDFLSDRSQQVVLEGKYSDSCPFLSGVPQGSVLAPLLFLLYINDISTNIQCTLRLYADDILILIYTSIKSLDDYNRLQHDLFLLQE